MASEESATPNAPEIPPPSDATTAAELTPEPVVAPVPRPRRRKRPPVSAEERARRADRARLQWAKRRAKAQGYQQSPIAAVTTRYTPTPEEKQAIAEALKSATPIVPTGDPWHDLPLHEVLVKLAGLESELKHAREVVTRRTDLLPKIATCWTALNRKDQAHLPGMYSAYAKCAKTFPQEKAKYIDNCVTNPETKLIDPVYCCSNVCYELYQTHRSQLRNKERNV